MIRIFNIKVKIKIKSLDYYLDYNFGDTSVPKDNSNGYLGISSVTSKVHDDIRIIGWGFLIIMEIMTKGRKNLWENLWERAFFIIVQVTYG